MENSSLIIEALGGTNKVANELGLTPSTVSSWKSSGRIPKWRLGDVGAFAKKIGVDLSKIDQPTS